MTDEERKARIHHHMYETCEGIAEHAERIVALEELCADMYKRFHGVVFECWAYSSDDFRMYEQRMDELGIPHD